MRKATKIKLNILLLLIAVVLGISAALLCTNGKTARADGSANLPDFYFNNSNMTVDIDEHKVMRVREELVVGFRENREYFVRRVPGKVSSLKYKDGKLSDGKNFLSQVRVSSVTVDGKPAEVSVNKNGTNNYVYVKNPEDRYARWAEDDKVTYKINLEYTVDFSSDRDGASVLNYYFFEETNTGFFYPVSDPEKRSRLNVTVNMPKPFGEDVHVYYGNMIYDECALKVEGNSINFSVPYGYTHRYGLRVLLPEGYFQTHTHRYNSYRYYVGAVGAFMLASLLITFIFRKRKPLAPIEYAPPVMNVMDYSAHWHGIARRKDVCTLLLQWARLGCIRIKKVGKRDIAVTKLKSLPKDCTAGEHGYFKALFADGKTYCSQDTRGWANRWRRRDLMRAAGKLIEEAGEPVTYARGVFTARFTVMLLSFLTPLICFLYFIVISGDYPFMFALAFTAAMIFAVLGSLYKVANEMRVEAKAHGRIFKLLYIAAAPAFIPVLILIVIMLQTQYMIIYDYIGLLFITVVWIVLSCYFLPPLVAKRSEESQKVYGRMVGFKTFLKAAKAPEMELMLEENPDYYLDVLPYCMIMGLSKKLDKKTEFLHAPDWADGFDEKRFAQSLFGTVKRSVVTRKKKEKK